MGDAARQLADRFHLLRLEELILDLAPIGNIDPGADDLDDGSRRVQESSRLVPNPDFAPVIADEAVLGRDPLSGARRIELSQGRFEIVRVEVL
jgi:hypothetical protein